MNKYIIKNCPAFDSKYNECHSKIEPHKIYCIDNTDCVMKQIVELCRNKDYFVKRFPNAQFSSAVQNSELAYDILQLLKIQECE